MERETGIEPATNGLEGRRARVSKPFTINRLRASCRTSVTNVVTFTAAFQAAKPLGDWRFPAAAELAAEAVSALTLASVAQPGSAVGAAELATQPIRSGCPELREGIFTHALLSAAFVQPQDLTSLLDVRV